MWCFAKRTLTIKRGHVFHVIQCESQGSENSEEEDDKENITESKEDQAAAAQAHKQMVADLAKLSEDQAKIMVRSPPKRYKNYTYGPGLANSLGLQLGTSTVGPRLRRSLPTLILQPCPGSLAWNSVGSAFVRQCRWADPAAPQRHWVAKRRNCSPCLHLPAVNLKPRLNCSQTLLFSLFKPSEEKRSVVCRGFVTTEV